MATKHNLTKTKLTHNQTNTRNNKKKRNIQATSNRGNRFKFKNNEGKLTFGWKQESEILAKGKCEPLTFRFDFYVHTKHTTSLQSLQTVNTNSVRKQSKIKTTTRPAKVKEEKNRKLVESCVGDAALFWVIVVVVAEVPSRKKDTRKKQEGSKLSIERKLSEKYNFWILHTIMQKNAE